jgi:hypothetical protein
VDEAAFDRDHLLRPADEVPLAGVFRKCTAKTDLHGLVTGEPVGDHIRSPSGNLAPGTSPFTGHHRDLRGGLVVFFSALSSQAWHFPVTFAILMVS